MSAPTNLPLPKWATDLTHAFREIGVLLVALAPLDGALNKEPLTSTQIVVFVGVGCAAYLLAVLFESVYTAILNEFSS